MKSSPKIGRILAELQLPRAILARFHMEMACDPFELHPERHRTVAWVSTTPQASALLRKTFESERRISILRLETRAQELQLTLHGPCLCGFIMKTFQNQAS